MSEMLEITKAIEASNKAFDEFKKVNDDRIAKVEKGLPVQDDVKAKMDNIFKDMSEQKSIIESLEAKLKRPNFGGEKNDADEAEAKERTHFKSFILNGNGNDTTAIAYKSLSASSGPDGGFGIPKVIDGMIESTIVNVSPIRALASVVQVSTPDYHKLVNVHGTSSGWVGEKAPRTSTNTPQLEDINPPMGELYANPQATQTMLDDVFFNAEQWLADEVALEFARAEGAAFISGTGVNQPLGFLSGAAPVTTADATRAFGALQYVGTGASGAFKTLTSTVNPADDFYTLVATMKAGYRAGASFLMNKATLFTVMGFKDYQGRYVYSPMSAPGTTATILNYAVTEAEDMPALAANSFSVAFGNFKRGYLIVDRIGTRVIRDPFSNKPYIGFYTTKRLGGSVINSEAIKLIKFI